MGPVGIEFEWERDAKGYRKAEEAPSPNNALRILIGAPQIRFPENLPMPQSTGPEDALYVVRNGGTLIRYRADEDLDQIFREFVNTPPSADGAVAFANRWGQLVGPDDDGAEPVRLTTQAVKAMNLFIDAWPENEETNQAGLERALGADGLEIGNLKARLIFDRRTDAPRMQFAMPNLVTALWMHLTKILTSDTVMRRCLHCHMIFTAGVGTDRRLDAKFCSDEHRLTFHRLKNTELTPHQPRRRGRPRRIAA